MDEELRIVFEQDGEEEEVEVERVVSKMMKLRQITGGLVRGDGDSLHPIAEDKISVLKDILESRTEENTKIVIFVSFTHEIQIISGLLEKLGIGFLTLSGATSDEDREKLESTFKQDSRYDIVLIQISTGAEGLDFTSADTAIFYSPSFSFIHYSQACARIHRIGQTRTCVYINIIMEETIDEDIVGFLEQHSNLSSEMLDGKRDYTTKKSSIQTGDDNGTKRKARPRKSTKKHPKRN
jgi:SNF2 family DNA or RNA helicase